MLGGRACLLCDDVLRRRMRTCVLSVSSTVGRSIPALRLGTSVPRQKNNSALKKGRQKGRVDEADISSLPHQPARNAFGILWAGRTAPASHIKEPKIETQKCYA